jgi:signal peptidase II
VTGERKKQLTWVLVTFLCVVALDQATKAWVNHAIPENSVLSSQHEGEFFWLTHQRNPGMVGGMFRHVPVVAKTAPIVATLILGYLFFHLDPVSRFQSFAYGLVAGGAIGNLIDRLVRGEVVDFLQFHFYFIPFDFPWKQYPAFNVADSCICSGVFLLILSWHRAGRSEKESSDAAHAH